MSLQKRLESRIKMFESELKRMKELNRFLIDPMLSAILIELDAEALKAKAKTKSAGNGTAKSEPKAEATPVPAAAENRTGKRRRKMEAMEPAAA